MANTYTQIYIHAVFTVRRRESLIPQNCKEELFKYITGIVKNRKQKLIAINGTSDHVHMFIGMKPDIALSDLLRDVKAASSGFINERGWVRGKFHWQEGFGAFSCGHRDIDRIVRYIQNQEAHHAKKSFLKEYKHILHEYDVDYDERYIFTEINA